MARAFCPIDYDPLTMIRTIWLMHEGVEFRDQDFASRDQLRSILVTLNKSCGRVRDPLLPFAVNVSKFRGCLQVALQ